MWFRLKLVLNSPKGPCKSCRRKSTGWKVRVWAHLLFWQRNMFCAIPGMIRQQLAALWDYVSVSIFGDFSMGTMARVILWDIFLYSGYYLTDSFYFVWKPRRIKKERGDHVRKYVRRRRAIPFGAGRKRKLIRFELSVGEYYPRWNELNGLRRTTWEKKKKAG